ncbi:hypothetical protein, partial [Salipiger thiooxidans]|uniref:hypothetical protein n=1 Tax=Salipiger thiooxidans TaxID=282683 RepID=UPI001A906DFA
MAASGLAGYRHVTVTSVRQRPNPAPATIVSDQALAIRGGFVVSDSPKARIPARSPLSSILYPS